MSGSRFKNFSESNNNKYIFISENKILYDKSEKSYKFDANYLILEGDIDMARIGIYHDDDEYIYAVNLKDITLVNKPEDAELIEIRTLANFNPENDGVVFTAKQLVHGLMKLNTVLDVRENYPFKKKRVLLLDLAIKNLFIQRSRLA